MNDSKTEVTVVSFIKKINVRLRNKIRFLIKKITDKKIFAKLDTNKKNLKPSREKINEDNILLLKKIKQRIAQRGKVNIAFLVNDSTKWNASNLVQAFLEDPRFDCKLYLTLTGRDKTQEERANTYLKEKAWFLSLNLPLIDLYDVDTNIVKPITSYDFDIIFFQQPWGLRQILKQVVGYALPAYLPYAYHVYANYKMQYKKSDFLPWLWRYFEQSEWHKKAHLRIDPEAEAQIVVTGYPKLDVYLDSHDINSSIWKGINPKKRVIYAPHHSVGDEVQSISTFEWNHDFIFTLAQKYPDISWIYRPHARLPYAVTRTGLMSKETYEKYEQGWDRLESTRTYLQGAYFDVFKSSDILITDSSSFLGEYMPTGNPVIWLKAKNPKVVPNNVGKKITNTYYQAHNVEELEKYFIDVVIHGNDYLKEKRLAVMQELFPKKESASQKIKKHLEEELGLL